MKRDQIVTFFFFALLAFVLYQVLRILAPFSGAIFWSILIAFGCHPVYRWIRRRGRVSESVAALLSTAMVLVVVLPSIFLVLLTLASQAIRGYESARSWIEKGGLERIQTELRRHEIYRKIESRIHDTDAVTEPSDWDMEKTFGILKSTAGFIAIRIGRLTGNLFVLLVNLALMLILLFFFFRDGERIYGFVYAVTPMEAENKELVFARVRDTFAAVIRGQFLTTLVQGILAWIVYWILGVPLALFFGFLTALAAMIPALGAALVWLPLAVGLAAYGRWVQAAILVVVGAAGISTVDNILKPFLIGGKARLPYLLMLLGILGGIQVYGLIGIFLAPLLLSLLFVLIQLYREKYPDPTP